MYSHTLGMWGPYGWICEKVCTYNGYLFANFAFPWRKNSHFSSKWPIFPIMCGFSANFAPTIVFFCDSPWMAFSSIYSFASIATSSLSYPPPLQGYSYWMPQVWSAERNYLTKSVLEFFRFLLTFIYLADFSAVTLYYSSLTLFMLNGKALLINEIHAWFLYTFCSVKCSNIYFSILISSKFKLKLYTWITHSLNESASINFQFSVAIIVN